MTRFEKARRHFEQAAQDRERFREVCTAFLEAEMRKQVRHQDWILWAVLRDVAFEAGLVHIWQGAYDQAAAKIETAADQEIRNALERSAKVKLDRTALIRARHQALKARRAAVQVSEAVALVRQ